MIEKDQYKFIDIAYVIIHIINGTEWIHNFYEREEEAEKALLYIKIHEFEEILPYSNDYYIKKFIRILDNPQQLSI